MINEFWRKKPCIPNDVWIDPSAILIVDIKIDAGAGIWPGAVLWVDAAGIHFDQW